VEGGALIVTWLDIELALHRRWAPFALALVVTLAGVLMYVLLTVPLEARIEERRIEGERLARTSTLAGRAQAPAESLLAARLNAFESTLGSEKDLAVFVGRVFEQAHKLSLVLAQADYKLEFDKAGQFYHYQMTLPVRGDYARLRAFVDAVLAEIPCAALDDIDIKRESIAATEAEVRLRFVFFLRVQRS
jgi:hypothetical protein